ncbi:MAG: hypothetical protein ACJ8F3_08270 [Xanthobacteraceae bacterium]
MRPAVISWNRAANDNDPVLRPAQAAEVPPWPDTPRVPLARSMRPGARPLAIIGFSLLVLMALCGAFLVGLAAVGVVAAATAAIEVARRSLRRKPYGVLDHQPAG